MNVIIAKFGGTSVANLRRIERCIPIIKKLSEKYKVVVVVSAMAGTTNKLQTQLDSFSKPTPFHDLILSSGEQITVGLFCLMLEKHGLHAKSFLGWQVPILTTDTATDAIIKNIDTKNIEDSLAFIVPDFCLAEVTESDEVAGGILCHQTMETLRPFLNKHLYKDINL